MCFECLNTNMFVYIFSKLNIQTFDLFNYVQKKFGLPKVNHNVPHARYQWSTHVCLHRYMQSHVRVLSHNCGAICVLVVERKLQTHCLHKHRLVYAKCMWPCIFMRVPICVLEQAIQHSFLWIRMTTRSSKTLVINEL